MTYYNEKYDLIAELVVVDGMKLLKTDSIGLYVLTDEWCFIGEL